jgi:hypothetical protein
MQLTERDREIIRLVREHRFLRSSHISSLLSDGSQHLLRRLQLLYHHGYLERPRSQLDYYHKGGSHPIVYGLGDRGATVSKHEHDEVVHNDSWSEKNRSAGRIYLEHELLVADVMVAIELACRKTPGVRFLTERHLLEKTTRDGHPQGFRWRVNVGNTKLGVIPDRVFALEYDKQSGGTDRAFFFLEADRGTMPVERKNLAQTSMYRKLLAYEATWSQSIHWKRFGFNRFRVMTVTTNAKRLNSLLECCSQLKKGKGLFLFSVISNLSSLVDPYSLIWQTCHEGETEGLLK